MRPPSNKDTDAGLKKGPWTPEEDQKLIDYIHNHGQCSWQLLPKKAGLNRCGKSCRLRWTNYLRPDIRRGNFSVDEEQTIIDLHSVLGNKWSMIATRLPGRTDNEIKNFWNTHIRKKLLQSGIDPKTHKPITNFDMLLNLPPMLHTSNLNNLMNNPILENLSKIRLLFNTLELLKTHPLPTLNQFDSPFSGILSPLQVSSMATNVETLPIGYQPVFDTFGTIPCLPDSENNGIISSNSGEYRLPALVTATPEVSSNNQVQNSLNSVQIPNHFCTSNNYSDVWGEVLTDDEASSSFWNDMFNDPFPAASQL